MKYNKHAYDGMQLQTSFHRAA